MPATVACPHCGTALGGYSRFCATCGNPVPEVQERVSTAEVAPFVPKHPDALLLERVRAATLGEYEIYGELGRGGMAAVYLAHDIALDRKVAIKVMLPEHVTGPGAVDRFRREARTAGALSHPHIIPIFAVKEADGMLYFVMKFVEGRGLDSVIAELGPLPLPMVQTVLSQVAGALAHAHRKNVVHRDIKPANIMLDEDGWAVVTDFGIAKVQDAVSLTATGTAIGTPYYMSPEQCSGKPVTGASDQYSLGVMAYEMLTGVTPFGGESVLAVMSGHFFKPPASIQSLRGDCPAALEAVVLRMLAKDAAERFPTLEDAVTAIAAPQLAHDDPVRTQMVTLAKSAALLRPSMSVPVSPVPVGRRPTAVATSVPIAPAAAAPRSRRTVVMIAGGAVLVAAGVIGAVVLRPRPDALALAAPAASAPATPTVPVGTATQGVPEPLATPVSAAPSPVTASPQRSVREAQLRRDSLAAAARRDSLARADSLVRVARAKPAVEPAPAPVAAPQPATTPAAAPPAAAPENGFVLFGTRTPAAAYYVNGAARGVISGLTMLRLRPGTVRLGINAEGCAMWDTTFTVTAGDTLRLGYRTPRCP